MKNSMARSAGRARFLTTGLILAGCAMPATVALAYEAGTGSTGGNSTGIAISSDSNGATTGGTNHSIAIGNGTAISVDANYSNAIGFGNTVGAGSSGATVVGIESKVGSGSANANVFGRDSSVGNNASNSTAVGTQARVGDGSEGALAAAVAPLSARTPPDHQRSETVLPSVRDRPARPPSAFSRILARTPTMRTHSATRRALVTGRKIRRLLALRLRSAKARKMRWQAAVAPWSARTPPGRRRSETVRR
jgi:hypothetical protein